ncbi:MAG: hypothetical protein AUJ51_05675 [Elusimicrobia bacterium CG1_02_56_21]|nr:MAG: hypothetical protein AUJ51_05675 [Elusimicrobia bacterium CG1_02_56_21]
MLRGDFGFGNERIISAAEERGLDYLFKLRSTVKVHWLVENLFKKQGWEDAGQGWEAMEAQIQLQGWSRQRRRREPPAQYPQYQFRIHRGRIHPADD